MAFFGASCTATATGASVVSDAAGVGVASVIDSDSDAEAEAIAVGDGLTAVFAGSSELDLDQTTITNKIMPTATANRTLPDGPGFDVGTGAGTGGVVGSGVDPIEIGGIRDVAADDSTRGGRDEPTGNSGTINLSMGFFAADFFTALFLATAFFAADFLAGDFLVALFLLVAFFTPDFLATAFLAAGFFGLAFFATDFLALAFFRGFTGLAGDFLATAFFAAAFFGLAFFATGLLAFAFFTATITPQVAVPTVIRQSLLEKITPAL